METRVRSNLDGVYAAGFLNEFKRLLENPNELPA